MESPAQIRAGLFGVRSHGASPLGPKGMDVAGILGQVAGGGMDGGVVLAIVGAMRNMIGK